MDLRTGARRIVLDCGGVRYGERVAVILEDGSDTDVAAALAAAAREAGAAVDVMTVDARALSPEADPGGQSCAATTSPAADVLFGVTARSLYHSRLGRDAAAAGARVLALTGCSPASLSGGAIEADFAALEPRCRALTSRLTGARRLSVTAPSGTSLSADLTGRVGYANTGRALRKGDRTGCLDVEAFIAPLEGSVSGTFVADGSTTLYGKVDAPVTITIRDGRLVDCNGGKDAARIRQVIAEHGPPMSVIAEFGFGLNPSATVVGDIIQDEATYGTGHMALGSNESFGGANPAPLHFDLVYWHPTLLLDDEVVMAGGRLIHEEQS